jgi:hypothetical protein
MNSELQSSYWCSLVAVANSNSYSFHDSFESFAVDKLVVCSYVAATKDCNWKLMLETNFVVTITALTAIETVTRKHSLILH